MKPVPYLRQIAGSILSRKRQLLKRTYILRSKHLGRQVFIDVYRPAVPPWRLLSLVVFNDGQDLERMRMEEQLRDFYAKRSLSPTLVVGVHCGDRMREYGIANRLDYKGRGDLALAYEQFVLEELMPWLIDRNNIYHGADRRSIAGFSLGGLSAFDLAWRQPQHFKNVGVFSGALWYRSKAFDPADPDADRIVHDYVRRSKKPIPNRFWFMAGTEDEVEDRNQNGVIDAIDDTIQLIALLKQQGVEDTEYIEVEGGRHDPETWGRVVGDFLHWAVA